MDKKELVEKFFEQGFLLSPQIVEKVTEKMLLSLQKSDALVIEELPERPAIFLELPEEKDTLSVRDFVDFYREKYEGIAALLIPKLKPVSISNAAKTRGETGVIGMVVSQSSSGFILEDPTGGIEVISQKRPDLRDVVGVTGQIREGKLIEGEMVYPDIPLPKEVKREEIVFIFSSAQAGAEVKIGLNGGEENLAIPRLPAKISVRGVEVVIAEAEGNPVEWLKKRHLPEQVRGPKDFYLISKVPDVLWVISKEAREESYKGVTIVRTVRGQKAKVDMKTRDVEMKEIDSVA